VEPFVVRVAARQVGVVLAPKLRGVASNLGMRTTSDNDGSMSSVAGARISVVNENITRTDVGGRRLMIAALASPAVLVSKAVTKVLGANFFLAARIATAWTTLVQLRVTTSKKALGDKVGTVTTIVTIAAELITPVGIRSASVVTTAAPVVVAIPPCLGVGNSPVTVVGSSTSCKSKKSNNSLHVTN